MKCDRFAGLDVILGIDIVGVIENKAALSMNRLQKEEGQ
jgi:hypothetical protein